MREHVIGQLEDKILFLQLAEVKDPIVKGLDEQSEQIGCFLSEWNIIESAKSLLNYLIIVRDQNTFHEEFEELTRFGIFSEFGGFSMLFESEGVIVTSEKTRSQIISFEQIISIVENWISYLTILKHEDAVFFGGKFFLNPKTKIEISEILR